MALALTLSGFGRDQLIASRSLPTVETSGRNSRTRHSNTASSHAAKSKRLIEREHSPPSAAHRAAPAPGLHERGEIAATQCLVDADDCTDRIETGRVGRRAHR